MEIKIGQKNITGIRVERGTYYMWHRCCDCGCEHRVKFGWPQDAVTMKWERKDDMSYDEKTEIPQRKILRWVQDWVSDWFGLLDGAVGILTLTIYYPRTQEWFLRRCGR